MLELLEDVQPEVRVNASQVLSGLLHCEFIPNPNHLLVRTFKKDSHYLSTFHKSISDDVQTKSQNKGTSSVNQPFKEFKIKQFAV